MVLWWIGNAVLLVVVLPVVIALLNRVLAALERIRAASDDILSGAGGVIGDLDGVPEALATTDKTVKEVAAGAVRSARTIGMRLAQARRRNANRGARYTRRIVHLPAHPAVRLRPPAGY